MKSRKGLSPPHLVKKRTRVHTKHPIASDLDRARSKKSKKVIFSDQSVRGRHHTSAKSAPHTLYSSFEDTVDGYQDGAAATRSQQLQDTFDSLAKRLHGVDVDEHNLDLQRSPNETDIEALELERMALTLSFDEETMTHKKLHPDGTESFVDIKLGESMQSFAKRIAQKRSELEKLLSALDEVQSEIRTARDDIVRAEESEAKRTGDELTNELRKILEDAESARDLTLSEVSAGRNEDQMLKAEASRKFQELVNAFSS